MASHHHYMYRGGFSTSICDGLFARHDEQRSDCCALTCCGVLLYDRNKYLLTNQRPSWNYRCCNCIVLVIVLVLWILSGVFFGASAVPDEDEDEDDSDNENHDTGKRGKHPVPEPAYRKSSSSTAVEDDNDNDTSEDWSVHLSALLFGIFVGLCFYFLFQAASQRIQMRKMLMVRMYEERNPLPDNTNDDDDDDDQEQPPDASTPLVTTVGRASVETFLQLQSRTIRLPHWLCSCMAKDDILLLDPPPTNLPPGDLQDPSSSTRNNNKSDLCYCLWKTLSNLCCGTFCGCWIQLCGMCAIGQEDRELQKLLPRESFQIDFLTFQPFTDYKFRLEALRQNEVKSLWSHMSTLSKLSTQLVQILAGILVALALIAGSGLDPFFQPINLVVVVLVLVQAFVILYFVHWYWNRFDLSFDAVVKYFASGFILGTTNAFIYEMLVSTTLSIGGLIVKIIVILIMVHNGQIDSEHEDVVAGGAPSDTGDTDDQALSGDEGELHLVPIWLLVIVAFLNAFAVAAMVEELTKYFGFWMVEHPDLAFPDFTERDSEAVPLTSSTTANSTNPALPTTSEPRTFKSVGAGITVAMVTTAMGFACCENFMYVFFYAHPSNPSTEISTLLARSIFPVHPLAAAIQSIGVCRRDLEKDPNMGLGWIILPAVMLHGSFDFALMLLDFLYKRDATANQDDNGDTDDDSPLRDNGTGDVPKPGASADNVTLEEQLPALCFSVGIVVIGAIYYVWQARAQRRRLEELDKRRQREGSDYEQLS